MAIGLSENIGQPKERYFKASGLQNSKVRELAKARGVSDSKAFREVVETGFQYYWPEIFGELEPTNAISDKEASTFYDIFSRGFDRSEFLHELRVMNASARDDFYALSYMLMAIIAILLEDDNGAGMADLSRAVRVNGTAREFAERMSDISMGDADAPAVIAKMDGEGLRVPIYPRAPQMPSSADDIADLLDDDARLAAVSVSDTYGVDFSQAARMLLGRDEVDENGHLTERGKATYDWLLD